MPEEKKYKFVCGQHNIRTNNPMIWQSHIRAKHPDIELNREGQMLPAGLSSMKELVEEKMKTLPPPSLPPAPQELAKETEEMERANEEIKKLPTIAKMNQDIAETRKAVVELNTRQERASVEMTQRLDAILGKLSEPAPPKAPPEPVDLGKTTGQSAQSRLDATIEKVSGETPSGGGSPKEKIMEELRQKMTSGTPGNTPPAPGQQPTAPTTGQPPGGQMPAMDPKAAQVLMYASAFAEILDKLPFWRKPADEAASPIDKTFLNAFGGFVDSFTKMGDIISRFQGSARKSVIDELKFLYKISPEGVAKILTTEETKPETKPEASPGGGEGRTHLTE